ncbi:hypothetical protein Pcinc_000813 [Petrolisthes cinctipes]|uniref:Reverse transcriptase/retrotransposon-derived protein RNase H-like domain-containing protein n=1 Tax=Petrolisthes cinctipes TaxID=88211 RepID=A0AAE1GP61_PETCI|nr:hypothetical protein Pcinc_000813 [Petrolisthes cinctipes]
MVLLCTALADKLKEQTWGPPQANAFQKVKDTLGAAALLAFPAQREPLIVTTDASNIAIGAVLEQIIVTQPSSAKLALGDDAHGYLHAAPFRHHDFNLIHGLTHPSRRATTRLLTQKVLLAWNLPGSRKFGLLLHLMPEI